MIVKYIPHFMVISAMQKIQQWTAAFDYTDLDRVIDQRVSCPLKMVSLASSYNAINIATHKYVTINCLAEKADFDAWFTKLKTKKWGI